MFFEDTCQRFSYSFDVIASYADALWARHAIFLLRGGGRLRDEPKERLRRRLLMKGREAKDLRDSVGSTILKDIPTSSSGDTFVVEDRVFLACMFWINLNFRKFKRALNPTYRIFLNFAKICVLSCLLNVDNMKKFHRPVFEL